MTVIDKIFRFFNKDEVEKFKRLFISYKELEKENIKLRKTIINLEESNETFKKNIVTAFIQYAEKCKQVETLRKAYNLVACNILTLTLQEKEELKKGNRINVIRSVRQRLPQTSLFTIKKMIETANQ